MANTFTDAVAAQGAVGAASALELTAWDILKEVSDSLGVGTRAIDPVGDEWTRCRRIIEAGYRQYLFPPPLSGEKRGHKWSFLTPTTTLTLASGDWDYNLEEDFAFLRGTFTYETDAVSRTIKIVSEGMIRAMRAGDETTGDPYYAAIRPRAFTYTTGQRFEVIFYPTPSAIRTLYYSYGKNANQKLFTAKTSGTSAVISGTSNNTLTKTGETFTTDGVQAADYVVLTNPSGPNAGVYLVSSVTSETVIVLNSPLAGSDGAGAAGTCDYEVFNPGLYPMGGMPHSETVLESCLAVAESRREDNVTGGLHRTLFFERLAASVSMDRALAPDSLGLNLDLSDVGEEVERLTGTFYYNDELLTTL